MATEEIHVFGAGVFGLSIAFQLLRQGVKVTVIDPSGPGAGASGGIVGALAPHTPDNWNEKKAFQLESLRMSAKFWDDVRAVSSLKTGFRQSGRVQPLWTTRNIDNAEKRVNDAAINWGPHDQWEVQNWDIHNGWRLRDAPPKGVIDTLSALIHPAQAITALARAVERLGGDLVSDPPKKTARQLWATGCHGLKKLGVELGRTIGSGVKGQALLLDADFSSFPQLFAQNIHFIPHSNGTLAIGATSERDFSEPDTTDEHLHILHDQALMLVPELQQCAVLGRWAGVRPRARSRAPLLGVHPRKANVFIANGGFKIGFGMAPKIAEIMAVLILEGIDQIPVSFRLSGFGS